MADLKREARRALNRAGAQARAARSGGRTVRAVRPTNIRVAANVGRSDAIRGASAHQSVAITQDGNADREGHEAAHE